MIRVDRYMSHDGNIFETEAMCLAYEKLDERVMAVICALPKHDNLNHGEAFRHDKSAFEMARKAATELICELGVARKHSKEQVYEYLCFPMSSLHRILSEVEIPVRKLSMFNRYNSDGVEFEQPYFNINPSEAKYLN